VKRILFILALAAILSHGLFAVLTGSFDPLAWSALEKVGCILVVAPLLALAIAVVDGAFDASPAMPPRCRTRRYDGRGC
jgi:hypothetical protein